MNSDKESVRTHPISKKEKESSLKSSFRKSIADWSISGYVLSNAISSGAFLVLFIGLFLNHILEQPFMSVRPSAIYSGTVISILFLLITFGLLVRDIEDYSKFFKGLFTPSKDARFVKGAYSILLFGLLISAFAFTIWSKSRTLSILLIYPTALAALLVSLITTYLLDQNKEGVHWNQFALSLHMVVHSFMAGAAAFSIADAFFRIGTTWGFYVDMVIHIAIVCNVLVNILEFILTRKRPNQRNLVNEITRGKFKYLFWIGNVLVGNVIPFILVFFSDLPFLQTLAGVCIVIGIFIIDKIWIAAPTYLNSLDSEKKVINN